MRQPPRLDIKFGDGAVLLVSLYTRVKPSGSVDWLVNQICLFFCLCMIIPPYVRDFAAYFWFSKIL